MLASWMWLFSVLFVLRLSASVVLAQEPPGPPSTNPSCSDPPLDQCSFYADCLESRYHCGPSGYPIGYGQYYCEKFSNASDLFDTRGKEWMIATMHCLQLALVEAATNPLPTTCEALKDTAFASHAECYVSNGFCTLGIKDWAAVLEIVGVGAIFSSWDAFNATVETVEDCAELYWYMVGRGVVLV